MVEQPIEPVIDGAARALDLPGASWMVVSDEPLSRRARDHVRIIELGLRTPLTPGRETGEAGRREFVLKAEHGPEAGESAVLQALAGSELPVPRVLAVEAHGDGVALAMSRLPGRPLVSVLQSVNANWEFAAVSTAMAQLLARIHALDWRDLVPWMTDPAGGETPLLLAQLHDRLVEWEERIRQAPGEQIPLFNRALDWLRFRTPTSGSLCLCHGDFTPSNLLSDGTEITGVVDWDRALVTDPSWDLALMPFAVSRAALPPETGARVLQSFIGAYVDASSRTLENLPFFIVARLLDEALQATTIGADDGAPSAGSLDEYLGALEGALDHGGQFPW